MEPVVELAQVEKRYGEVPVLRGVSLQIAGGELVAITGRSGSGKSTLLQIVGGLDRAYTGSVKVGGRELGTLDDAGLARLRASEVGFVFQAFHLLDHLTVRENVQLPAYFAGSRASLGEAGRVAADAALARVDMATFADSRPSALSGGQRQRVAIARALFGSPRLLLCDEPTGNLDAQTGDQVIDIFRALHESGITIVIVTHEERVARAASRAVHLVAGSVS
jgi:putative ABC transport system ATP-binding protein